MNKLNYYMIASAVGLALSAQSMAAELSDADYAAAEQKIEAEHTSALLACESLSGTENEICIVEAEGANQTAKAELEANQDGDMSAANTSSDNDSSDTSTSMYGDTQASDTYGDNDSSETDTSVYGDTQASDTYGDSDSDETDTSVYGDAQASDTYGDNDSSETDTSVYGDAQASDTTNFGDTRTTGTSSDTDSRETDTSDYGDTRASDTSSDSDSDASDALFDFDSAELSADSRAKLDDVVNKSKDNAVAQINVTGHTDRLGDSAYNQHLSEERTKAVKEYLVSEGIDESRIRSEGKGDAQSTLQAGECQGEQGAAVIACLQPDRRVVVSMNQVVGSN